MTAEKKWVVVGTAPNRLAADMWRALLVQAEIPAFVDATDSPSYLGVSGLPCRVMVPKVLLERARSIIGER